MEPTRSALFIPGSRETWVESAHENDADVIILDLEDSVPVSQKEAARTIVVDNVAKLREKGQRVHVRINGHPNDTEGFVTEDLEALACEEVEALVVPKVRDPDDVRKIDTILTHLERREELEVGSTELSVSIETAQGMRQVYEVCETTERVATITCGAVKGTDTNYALGFDWTGPGSQGTETIHLREKALMDARAAEIEYPLAGTYVDIDDIEGLRQDMQFSKEMGYTGYVAIHPSHVEHANEIFLPDSDEVEYWIGALEAMQKAESEGKSAVRYRGDMIDIANKQTAEQYLAYAEAFSDELDLSTDADLTALRK